MDKNRFIKALTETQKTIIMRELIEENYSLEQSMEDFDLIANITEIKIKLG